MCYRNYLGVPCKFGSECKHIHAAPNSAARREFEQNPAEMERYGAWLETFQEARKEAKSSPGSPTATPPPAAHAATAKSPKKKVKKKKGSGPTVNTATKETQELAPKLTGKTGSLSVTAPEANVTEIHEFHPLMMWHLECQAPAPPGDLVSSIQIGDRPIVYGYCEASMVHGAELTVLMVTEEQDSRTEWLSGIDGLVISTAESSDGISLLSAMAGKGTHGDGTQAWMRKGFMTAVKGMRSADKDIQIAAMVCSSRYDNLCKEQAA
jgi:hypothetical protein